MVFGNPHLGNLDVAAVQDFDAVLVGVLVARATGKRKPTEPHGFRVVDAHHGFARVRLHDSRRAKQLSVIARDPQRGVDHILGRRQLDLAAGISVNRRL